MTNTHQHTVDCPVKTVTRVEDGVTITSIEMDCHIGEPTALPFSPLTRHGLVMAQTDAYDEMSRAAQMIGRVWAEGDHDDAVRTLDYMDGEDPRFPDLRGLSRLTEAVRPAIIQRSSANPDNPNRTGDYFHGTHND